MALSFSIVPADGVLARAAKTRTLPQARGSPLSMQPVG